MQPVFLGISCGFAPKPFYINGYVNRLIKGGCIHGMDTA